MDLLGTSINAAFVAIVGLLLWWLFRGRFDALDRRIDRLEERLVGTEERLDGRLDRLETRLVGTEERLDGRLDRLETRLVGTGSRPDGRFDGLQASMDAMRSDLTQVALAVGVRPRAQNDWPTGTASHS